MFFRNLLQLNLEDLQMTISSVMLAVKLLQKLCTVNKIDFTIQVEIQYRYHLTLALVTISEYKPFWVSRFDPVESVTDVEPTIPWWLSCNKDRFPYWFGHREPRLKFLYQALLQPELYKMDDFMFSQSKTIIIFIK